MNHGAALAAQGGLLWFVHADTRVPEGADVLILEALSHAPWGRFDIRLSGRGPLLRVVETLVNLRSRVSGIATGDQGIFVRREAFDAVGGFPDIPLMEDVAISRLLRRLARPRCLRARLTTSSRRWEARGILKTVWLMWRLRVAYALGADPRDLARRYRV
jgi:rSAM/selenodomain-associated transferase 2